MDGRTKGWSDTTFYRDEQWHLKRNKYEKEIKREGESEGEREREGEGEREGERGIKRLSRFDDGGIQNRA